MSIGGSRTRRIYWWRICDSSLCLLSRLSIKFRTQSLCRSWSRARRTRGSPFLYIIQLSSQFIFSSRGSQPVWGKHFPKCFKLWSEWVLVGIPGLRRGDRRKFFQNICNVHCETRLSPNAHLLCNYSICGFSRRSHLPSWNSKLQLPWKNRIWWRILTSGRSYEGLDQWVEFRRRFQF